MKWPQRGGYWELSSTVWGASSGRGSIATARSPLGGDVQSIRLLDGSELEALFQPMPTLEPTGLRFPMEALAGLLREHRIELIQEIRDSMGFTVSDSEEVWAGCVAVLDRFELKSTFDPSQYEQSGRRIGLRQVPWGTVAAILPQNAALYMGLIVLLNGLAAGNRVILRSPSGSYRIMAIFAQLVKKAGFDVNSFSVVACDAASFTDSWLQSRHPVLLHFMGSSSRAAEMLANSFSFGKPCLIDGEGNGWIYVDKDQDPIEAANLVWKGAIRYNGQTCTSINGAIVHPALDGDFRVALRKLVHQTTFGNGLSDDVGPVFSVSQLKLIDERAASCGGRVGKTGRNHGQIAAPLIIEDPDADSALVREGFFGPAVWVRNGDWEEFKTLWQLNRYPLCGGALSFDEDVQAQAVALAGASRVVINGDPSLEDPMEPWGAYPSCGFNPVGNWIDKYSRIVQVDESARG